MNEIKSFRTVALLEATSFLLLLIATAVKYGADNPTGVQILGPIHGALFVVYVFLALYIRNAARFTLVNLIGVGLGAVLPFGGYVVDYWMAKRERSFAATSEPSQVSS